MVSKKISDASYPVTVKIGKEMRDGTLVLKRNSWKRNGK